MGRCEHYSDARHCRDHCGVAEVGGRHLDLHEHCLLNAQSKLRKDHPDTCYRYQRARADANQAKADLCERMAERMREEQEWCIMRHTPSTALELCGPTCKDLQPPCHRFALIAEYDALKEEEAK